MPKSSTGSPGAQGTRPVTPAKPAPNKAEGLSPQVAKNYVFKETFPQGGGFQGERPPQRIDGKR
jgi:hypothetical protein